MLYCAVLGSVALEEEEEIYGLSDGIVIAIEVFCNTLESTKIICAEDSSTARRSSSSLCFCTIYYRAAMSLIFACFVARISVL